MVTKAYNSLIVASCGKNYTDSVAAPKKFAKSKETLGAGEISKDTHARIGDCLQSRCLRQVTAAVI